MFGMLEGCGEGMGIVFVFGDPFRATFLYESFSSGQLLLVPRIIDRRLEGGVSMFDVLGGVVDKWIAYYYSTYFYDQL